MNVVTISMYNNDNQKCRILYQGEYHLKDKIAYIENDTKAYTSLNFFDDGLIMQRDDKEHRTFLHLFKNDSYALIESEYGKLKLDVELLQYIKTSDKITAQYRLNEVFTIIVDY